MSSSSEEVCHSSDSSHSNVSPQTSPMRAPISPQPAVSPPSQRDPSPLTSPLHQAPSSQTTSPIQPVISTSGSSTEDDSDSPPRKRTRPARNTVMLRALLSAQNTDDGGDDVTQSVGVDIEAAGQPSTADFRDDSDVSSTISTSSSSSAIGSDGSDASSSRLTSISEAPGISSDTDGALQSMPLYDSDDSTEAEDDQSDNELLYEGSDLKTNRALYEVLKLYVSERWTKKSLDKSVKLIKKLLPKENNMPSSSEAVFQWLKEITYFFNNEREYYYCIECSEAVGDKNDSCMHCGNTVIGVFYSFSLEAQIKHMFEQRNLYSVIDYHRQSNQRKANLICDIQDGTEYVKIVTENNLGSSDLVLVWNTDGVNLSRSSKQELWGILGSICEVPPMLRSSFMLVFGVFVGSKKPNMTVFLKPFVDSLQDTFANGVSWIHPQTKALCQSKVVAPILSADAPAKAITLNVKQYNARYGCNTCEQKSEKVVVSWEGNENNRQPVRKRRFVFSEEDARLRTGLRMHEQSILAERRGKPRKGVIGESVTSNIPTFDRALCIAAEYLHVVLLGCTKYFLDLIFFKRGPWYIGDHINDIDNFMLHQIKVPDYIKRLPRRISSDFKFFKGSEFRAFLLHYSLPIFAQFLPKEYFQHWLMFVAAMHFLLSEAISEDNLKAAEILIRCFVRDIKSLYGVKYYTYNTHSLLHFPLLTKRWGPLWSTSAFTFEKYNGFITHHVHGTKHLGKELLKNIQIMQAVVALENIVSPTRQWLPRQNHDAIVQTIGKHFSSQNILNDVELAAITEANLENVEFFQRVRIDLDLYTCKFYDKNKKRANSFVQFVSNIENDGSVLYGEVLCFIRTKSNGFVYCLLQRYTVKHTEIFFHEESRFKVPNFVPIESEPHELCVVPVKSILMKVLKVGEYLCIPPNRYEVYL